MKAFLSLGRNFITLTCGHSARQLTILHRGRLTSLRDHTVSINIDRRYACAHGALVANVTHQSTRVDTFEGDNIPPFEIGIQSFLCAPTRGHAARFAHDKTFDPRTR